MSLRFVTRKLKTQTLADDDAFEGPNNETSVGIVCSDSKDTVEGGSKVSLVYLKTTMKMSPRIEMQQYLDLMNIFYLLSKTHEVIQKSYFSFPN